MVTTTLACGFLVVVGLTGVVRGKPAALLICAFGLVAFLLLVRAPRLPAGLRPRGLARHLRGRLRIH